MEDSRFHSSTQHNFMEHPYVVLELKMATHSSILAWRIPWIEEPGGLQSVGMQRARHKWSDLACIILYILCERKKVKLLSRVQLFATPWTVVYQASMGFFRQEYQGGLSFPSPGDLPNPGIEPRSPALQAEALPCEPPGKPHILCKHDR